MQSNLTPQITGHVRCERTAKGQVWYARYRTVDDRRDGTYGPTQKTRKLGPLWVGRGRPPQGSYTERSARDELVRILDAERERVAGGRPVVITFRQAALEWLRYAEHDRHVTPGTLADYVRTAHALIAKFGDTPIERITAQDIEAYKGDVTTAGRRGSGGKLAARTVNRHLVIAGGIFRRAERKWGIRHNPAGQVEKLRESKHATIRFLTVEQTNAVLATITDQADRAHRHGRLHGAAAGRALGAPVERRELHGLRGARAALVLHRRREHEDPEVRQGAQRADGGGRRGGVGQARAARRVHG
jgi:hypothetical protein